MKLCFGKQREVFVCEVYIEGFFEGDGEGVTSSCSVDLL